MKIINEIKPALILIILGHPVLHFFPPHSMNRSCSSFEISQNWCTSLKKCQLEKGSKISIIKPKLSNYKMQKKKWRAWTFVRMADDAVFCTKWFFSEISMH